MKTRFSTIDIAGVLPEINAQFSSLRLSNVYDIDNKTYLFKFNHPDAKKVLLIESGIRIHITEYDWPKSSFPSGFAMKLRKHLKSRRLEYIKQLGKDRIVDLQFGSGEAAYHVILELYDRGNVVLTDSELVILNILRTRTDSDKDVKYLVKEKYPRDIIVNDASHFTTPEQLLTLITESKPTDNLRKILVPKLRYGPAVIEHSLQTVGLPSSCTVSDMLPTEVRSELANNQLTEDSSELTNKQTTNEISELTDKQATENNSELTVPQPGGDNSEHTVTAADKFEHTVTAADKSEPTVTGADKSEPTVTGADKSEPTMTGADKFEHTVTGADKSEHTVTGADKSEHTVTGADKCGDCLKVLADVLDICEGIVERVKDVENLTSGFIINKMEKKASVEENKPEEIMYVYDEFHPLLFKQHMNRDFTPLTTFNRAVDEFFSKIEAQKIEMKSVHMEKQAVKKLENVRRDHEKRLSELMKEQETDKMKAYLIEINLVLVDRAIMVIRSALANQMSWSEIDEILKEAQTNHDPVARAIKSLKLDKNQITLKLRDEYEETNRLTLVDVDLSLSAYSNARKYYDQKRHAHDKEEKTKAASGKALKSAEIKTRQALKEMQVISHIVKSRKVAWYEKFNWFISCENYLVIAGRDGQQNEILVRRYFKTGDVYVHADIHGASSVIIKNHQPEQEIPPKTLNEAGTMAICFSSAWDSKIVTSAWWVRRDQVSKTAPSGEYLTTGSFMIRGRKNYLPPTYLVYGLGILFKLNDEESIKRHENERRVRVIEEDNESIITEQTESELHISEEELSEHEDNVIEENQPQTADNSSEPAESQSEATPTVSTAHIEESEQVVEDERHVEQADHVDIVKQEPEDSGSSSEEESLFPDTQIQLQHVSGSARFEVQRSISESSGSNLTNNDHVDNRPVEQGKSQSKAAMTRKQRRDIRKAKKSGKTGENFTEENTDQSEEPITEKTTNQRAEKSSNQIAEKSASQTAERSEPDRSKQAQPAAVEYKRGQRSKQKKIKQKYGDQEEEEREIKSAMLQDAERETKKRIKVKKQQKREEEQKQRKLDFFAKKEAAKQAAIEKRRNQPNNEADIYDELDDETEDTQANNTQGFIESLNSLTGCPVNEDELLFAVPVCAPYSSLNNYKYRVKFIPGSTKKGKAVKMSLTSFTNFKTITQIEKQLIRSLKDEEISRNIPGKVKVTSSIVHKSKR